MIRPIATQTPPTQIMPPPSSVSRSARVSAHENNMQANDRKISPVTISTSSGPAGLRRATRGLGAGCGAR